MYNIGQGLHYGSALIFWTITKQYPSTVLGNTSPQDNFKVKTIPKMLISRSTPTKDLTASGYFYRVIRPDMFFKSHHQGLLPLDIDQDGTCKPVDEAAVDD